jgi:hypothetical protein
MLVTLLVGGASEEESNEHSTIYNYGEKGFC